MIKKLSQDSRQPDQNYNRLPYEIYYQYHVTEGQATFLLPYFLSSEHRYDIHVHLLLQ
jgi:hypothetical protein